MKHFTQRAALVIAGALIGGVVIHATDARDINLTVRVDTPAPVVLLSDDQCYDAEDNYTDAPGCSVPPASQSGATVVTAIMIATADDCDAAETLLYGAWQAGIVSDAQVAAAERAIGYEVATDTCDAR